uniref:Uncharacterized protein n=1 Tax=Chromera velia CCMP2878 TaxID=1169474 RepID=A0A0G4F6K5_9ALVE|eukprot:Cvel_15459.t1-p1 / transcript=Cvel_15459.t1 / gene=Cvel_15459 / organism=Chromera_velia_CCMP2878 / gene_product=hypothetical protein / transcript_product=hypothetical protein / location=Cvel_scaffold1145:26929-34253(+) / protein_length=1289 / sequence_SO=supercontig / SO=protein_coding / is_pseudo=false
MSLHAVCAQLPFRGSEHVNITCHVNKPPSFFSKAVVSRGAESSEQNEFSPSMEVVLKSVSQIREELSRGGTETAREREDRLDKAVLKFCGDAEAGEDREMDELCSRMLGLVAMNSERRFLMTVSRHASDDGSEKRKHCYRLAAKFQNVWETLQRGRPGGFVAVSDSVYEDMQSAGDEDEGGGEMVGQAGPQDLELQKKRRPSLPVGGTVRSLSLIPQQASQIIQERAFQLTKLLKKGSGGRGESGKEKEKEGESESVVAKAMEEIREASERLAEWMGEEGDDEPNRRSDLPPASSASSSSSSSCASSSQSSSSCLRSTTRSQQAQQHVATERWTKRLSEVREAAKDLLQSWEREGGGGREGSEEHRVVEKEGGSLQEKAETLHVKNLSFLKETGIRNVMRKEPPLSARAVVESRLRVLVAGEWEVLEEGGEGLGVSEGETQREFLPGVGGGFWPDVAVFFSTGSSLGLSSVSSDERGEISEGTAEGEEERESALLRRIFWREEEKEEGEEGQEDKRKTWKIINVQMKVGRGGGEEEEEQEEQKEKEEGLGRPSEGNKLRVHMDTEELSTSRGEEAMQEPDSIGRSAAERPANHQPQEERSEQEKEKEKEDKGERKKQEEKNHEEEEDQEVLFVAETPSFPSTTPPSHLLSVSPLTPAPEQKSPPAPPNPPTYTPAKLTSFDFRSQNRTAPFDCRFVQDSSSSSAAAPHALQPPSSSHPSPQKSEVIEVIALSDSETESDSEPVEVEKGKRVGGSRHMQKTVSFLPQSKKQQQGTNPSSGERQRIEKGRQGPKTAADRPQGAMPSHVIIHPPPTSTCRSTVEPSSPLPETSSSSLSPQHSDHQPSSFSSSSSQNKRLEVGARLRPNIPTPPQKRPEREEERHHKPNNKNASAFDFTQTPLVIPPPSSYSSSKKPGGSDAVTASHRPAGYLECWGASGPSPPLPPSSTSETLQRDKTKEKIVGTGQQSLKGSSHASPASPTHPMQPSTSNPLLHTHTARKTTSPSASSSPFKFPTVPLQRESISPSRPVSNDSSTQSQPSRIPAVKKETPAERGRGDATTRDGWGWGGPVALEKSPSLTTRAQWPVSANGQQRDWIDASTPQQTETDRRSDCPRPIAMESQWGQTDARTHTGGESGGARLVPVQQRDRESPSRSASASVSLQRERGGGRGGEKARQRQQWVEQNMGRWSYGEEEEERQSEKKRSDQSGNAASGCPSASGSQRDGDRDREGGRGKERESEKETEIKADMMVKFLSAFSAQQLSEFKQMGPESPLGKLGVPAWLVDKLIREKS